MALDLKTRTSGPAFTWTSCPPACPVCRSQHCQPSTQASPWKWASCLHTHTHTHSHINTTHTLTHVHTHTHSHIYTLKHTLTHTLSCICAHTHIHTYTPTHMHMCTHTYTHTYPRSHTHSHNMHTYTHSHKYTHSNIHTHTHTYTLILSNILTHIHMHVHIHTLSHIFTHTHSLVHAHSHTYTHIHTVTHIHTHAHTLSLTLTHTHTHTVSSHELSPSLCYGSAHRPLFPFWWTSCVTLITIFSFNIPLSCCVFAAPSRAPLCPSHRPLAVEWRKGGWSPDPKVAAAPCLIPNPRWQSERLQAASPRPTLLLLSIYSLICDIPALQCCPWLAKHTFIGLFNTDLRIWLGQLLVAAHGIFSLCWGTWDL